MYPVVQHLAVHFPFEFSNRERPPAAAVATVRQTYPQVQQSHHIGEVMIGRDAVAAQFQVGDKVPPMMDQRRQHGRQPCSRRGRRIRELLKQPPHDTLPAPGQIVTLLAVTAGLFDAVSLDRIAEAEALVRGAVPVDLPDIWQAVARGDRLSDGDRATLISTMRGRLAPLPGDSAHVDD